MQSEMMLRSRNLVYFAAINDSVWLSEYYYNKRLFLEKSIKAWLGYS